MDTTIIPQKQCTCCKKYYPPSTEHFYTTKYGLTSRCKSCLKKKSREYEKKHPEKTKSTHAKNYQKNKPDRDRKNKEWYIKHPEAKRASENRYRNKHPDRCTESNQRWLDNNPLKRREYSGRRRIRHTEAEGIYTSSDIDVLLKTQKGLCWWCGVKLKGKYEIDHRIPLSRGGSNWPNNICLTCRRCNRSKSDKLPHEWSNRLI